LKHHVRELEGSQGESYTAGIIQRERRLSETGLLRVRRAPLGLMGAQGCHMGIPWAGSLQPGSTTTARAKRFRSPHH